MLLQTYPFPLTIIRYDYTSQVGLVGMRGKGRSGFKLLIYSRTKGNQLKQQEQKS
ncbi:hypothetical protein LYNGBM3L_57350 [Moorena producens 3L]|uniref:Uncharacterized protein n=1 Tax=Moorena producens 3L TaxID=489825 RepID=F4XZN6_9CYAN|nr:hypothetical protein LYNGBM3L_57350 [Moorena producens 3L]